MKGVRDEKQMCTKEKRLYLLAVFNEHCTSNAQPHTQTHMRAQTHKQAHTHTDQYVSHVANYIWCCIIPSKNILMCHKTFKH